MLKELNIYGKLVKNSFTLKGLFIPGECLKKTIKDISGKDISLSSAVKHQFKLAIVTSAASVTVGTIAGVVGYKIGEVIDRKIGKDSDKYSTIGFTIGYFSGSLLCSIKVGGSLTNNLSKRIR